MRSSCSIWRIWSTNGRYGPRTYRRYQMKPPTFPYTATDPKWQAQSDKGIHFEHCWHRLWSFASPVEGDVSSVSQLAFNYCVGTHESATASAGDGYALFPVPGEGFCNRPAKCRMLLRTPVNGCLGCMTAVLLWKA